nr:MAG TPA: hypothetical protein [Caudoviricetes sp.]
MLKFHLFILFAYIYSYKRYYITTNKTKVINKNIDLHIFFEILIFV